MSNTEQKFIDKFYEGRKTWSHDFIITLMGIIDDEIYRRVNDFKIALRVGVDEDGIQDM